MRRLIAGVAIALVACTATPAAPADVSTRSDSPTAPVSSSPTPTATAVRTGAVASVAPLASPSVVVNPTPAPSPAATANPTSVVSAPPPSPLATAVASMLDGVRAARWSSGVTVDVATDSFTVRATGLPDCGFAASYLVPKAGGAAGGPAAVPTSLDQLMAIANPMGAQNYNVRIPLVPRVAQGAPATRGGMIGITISGVAIFNPYEADGRTVALDANLVASNGIAFVDSSSGHPDPNRAYHYHGIPYCLSGRVDTAGQHSRIVGFLLDGYPVYGPYGEGGRVPGDLDQCNGHFGPTPEFPQGVWHYHFSTQTPYSFRCYHGTT